MTKIGLLSNPRSQRNRRGHRAIDEIAQSAGIVHRRLSDMSELGEALDDLADQAVEVIAVNGGDGTVQAVLTDLLERRPFAQVPALALVPRGMTNMTAADVGLRGRSERALARLVHAAEQHRLEPCLVRRHVLRLDGVPGFPPQRGMFFGAGAICRAIEYCRNKVHPMRAQANWAAGLTLLGLLSGRVLGLGGGVFAGEPVSIAFDNAPARSGDRLLVLATTLDRLVLGSRPFWNRQGGPVRFTAVAHPAERLVRRAPRVMYGGDRRNLPADDYLSRAAHRVDLVFPGPFTLDGQMFDPPAGEPLVITAPDAVDFVRC